MRALEFLIDHLPVRMPVEAVYVLSENSLVGGNYHRIPALLPTTNAGIECIGHTPYLSPALCYCALPEGLAVGVAGLIKHTLHDQIAAVAYKEFQPISRSLWRWSDSEMKDAEWFFTIHQLAKKPIEQCRFVLEDFKTPPLIFQELLEHYPDLPLPGTLVIVELTDLNLPLQNETAYEMRLMDVTSQTEMKHRYEVHLLD